MFCEKAAREGTVWEDLQVESGPVPGTRRLLVL
jgi:hypothetical protein